MKTIYLRDAAEPALKAALPWAVEGGEWVRHRPHLYELDIIGSLETEPEVRGEADPETGLQAIVTPAVYNNGKFHLNILLVDGYSPSIPPGLVVHPKDPRQAFA